MSKPIWVSERVAGLRCVVHAKRAWLRQVACGLKIITLVADPGREDFLEYLLQRLQSITGMQSIGVTDVRAEAQ